MVTPCENANALANETIKPKQQGHVWQCVQIAKRPHTRTRYCSYLLHADNHKEESEANKQLFHSITRPPPISAERCAHPVFNKTRLQHVNQQYQC